MPCKIAGIDVHKKVLMVVVIDATTPEEKPERRRFATMPSEMRRLSIWLREQGVEEAVMESTAPILAIGVSPRAIGRLGAAACTIRSQCRQLSLGRT